MDAIVKFRNRDNLYKNTKLIPLNCDIKDELGRITEVLDLNKTSDENSSNLNYALIKVDKLYYFIPIEDSVVELKFSIEDEKFICPCCLEPLIPTKNYTKKNGSLVSPYFRHYKDSPDCLFKYCLNSKHTGGSSNKSKNETDIHKYLKLIIIKIANTEGITLKMPVSYNIHTDYNKYVSRACFYYETIKISGAELGKKELKKDFRTKGYTPDIILYTDKNDKIYLEVSHESSKPISDYYSIWDRLNIPTLEIRSTDNIKDENMDLFIDVDYDKISIDSNINEYEKYFENTLSFRHLYNPVIHNARTDLINEKARVAQLLKEKKNQDIKKNNHNKEVKQVSNIAKNKNSTNKSAKPINLNSKIIHEKHYNDTRTNEILNITSFIKILDTIKEKEENGDVLNVNCKIKFIDDKTIELYDDNTNLKLKVGKIANVKKINSDIYIDLEIGINLNLIEKEFYVLYLNELNK